MRVRKFSPIDREDPIFEVLDDAGNPLFDISRSDAGFLEIAFSGAVANQVFLLEDFRRALDEAIALALAASPD